MPDYVKFDGVAVADIVKIDGVSKSGIAKVCGATTPAAAATTATRWVVALDDLLRAIHQQWIHYQTR